ncbi:MAG: PUR family DNA/RNA-binding protein [Bacteroidia bacterium]|nr:PUR family DNA/RNA-binding protein [Bacteroidia bacterium]
MQGRDEVYSEKIRAGKRTYFFDVRSTRSNDYYITITESKRRFNGKGYDKHKIFLYKEDFNKFLASLTKTVDHVKTELMPDYDYDEFDREREEYEGEYVRDYEGSENYSGNKEFSQASTESSALEMEETLSTSWED